LGYGFTFTMTGSTRNEIDIMEEKEAARAVQIEDVSGSGDVGYESAELEPRMNLQTIMAFILCSTARWNSLCEP
jgi:hypothetical protein